MEQYAGGVALVQVELPAAVAPEPDLLAHEAGRALGKHGGPDAAAATVSVPLLAITPAEVVRVVFEAAEAGLVLATLKKGVEELGVPGTVAADHVAALWSSPNSKQRGFIL